MTQKLIILGAGGNSIAIADAITAINAASSSGPVYELAGFLDDLPVNRGRTVMGAPVLGEVRDAVKFADCRFINGIASVDSFRLKAEILQRAGIDGDRFETIIHPTAAISSTARIGRGCAIMANTSVAPDAVLEDHIIVLQNSSINHHSRLASYCTISAGVTILGSVELGEGAFVSGGASIAPYVKVGEGAVIGLGSAVIRDVAAGSVVAGNPARELPGSRYADAR